MSKADGFENDVVKLVFQGVPIANIADQAASSPLTVLWVSLHSADPGEAGNQSTSELSYTGYGRVPVNRSTSGGWSVSGSTASNTVAVTFGLNTATAQTASHAGIGTTSGGTGKLLYSGQLTASLNITVGVTPVFAAGDLSVGED
jgi:hypothetical protein